MAGYDGSIRIDTKIDSTGFNNGIAGITKGFSGITAAAGKVGIALTAAFAVKQLIVFGKQAVELASDLQEVQNVVDTAFGSMAYKMEEFAETAIEMYGISKLTAKQTGSTFMAMARGMGLALEKSSDMSIQLTALSADMSSFYNVSQDVASTALKSIFTGETETLKQFGIVMTQANLQQFAYSQGINKSISSMSQAEQVQLRYMYVMQQTSMVQGDFAKTSSSWANQTRILSENWKEFLSILGSGLIQVLTPVVQMLNELLKGLIKIAKTIGYVIKLLSNSKDTSSDLAGSTDDLGTSAGNAADSENDLASGIGAAAKAAQSALAKFDQLDVLQKNMGTGGGGGGSFDAGDFDIGDLGLKDTEASLDSAKTKIDNFLIGLKDRLHEFATEPVLVFEPIFAPIPDPVYNPNWGLTPPTVELPVFPPISAPIYNPEWGLYETLSDEMGLVYGEIDEFEASFGISCNNVVSVLDGALYDMQQALGIMMDSSNSFETNFGISCDDVSTAIQGAAVDIKSALGTMAVDVNSFETNFGISAENTQATLNGALNNAKSWVTSATDYLIETSSKSLDTVAANEKAWADFSEENVSGWASNFTTAIYNAGNYFIENFGIALMTTADNIDSYAAASIEAIISWGEGVLKAGWEAAKGLATNFLSGLKTAWDNLKEFASATGEKTSGWWSENKNWAKPTLQIAGIALAGTAFVLSGGSLAAPLAAGATLIPALATGAVIPPNQQFMAVLGDQKHGRNLEAPESLIRQIMREEMAGLNTEGSITVETPVYLDGEVIYRNQQKVSRRHGTKLVLGGV